MPPMLAYGHISDDFLDQALHIFVGFWIVMIAIGLSYFLYVLISVKNRKKPEGDTAARRNSKN
jgi:hypothetical protein